MTERPLRILTVCTGNICRSPYAELLLQDRFDALAPGEFEVGSMGTAGLTDRPIEPPMDRILAVKGIASDDFLARRVDPAVVKMADLVLAAGVEHRDQILAMSPAALKKTYTLREFAATVELVLADGLDGFPSDDVRARWRMLTRRAAVLRASPALGGLVKDIDDPFLRGQAAFERAAAEIDQAVESILAFESAFRTGRQEKTA